MICPKCGREVVDLVLFSLDGDRACAQCTYGEGWYTSSMRYVEPKHRLSLSRRLEAMRERDKARKQAKEGQKQGK